MQEYRYLLDIALILLMTKAFGLFSRRLRMPSVVGALIAGSFRACGVKYS